MGNCHASRIVRIILLLFTGALCLQGSGQAEDRSDSSFNKALFYEKNKDYEHAFEFYMRYEGERPCAPEALRGLSRTATRAGQIDRYRQILRRRFSQYPGNQLVTKQYIESLYKSGEVEECLAVGRETIRRWPTVAELYRNLSTLYRSNGLSTEAIEILRKGRENLNRDDLFRRDMAELLLRTGDYISSTAEFLLFLKNHPGSITYVERRLLEAVKTSGDTTQIIALVRSAESEERCGWVFPLLIDLETATAGYERALLLIQNCREDRDLDESLRELLRLSRLSSREGLAHVAERALDEALRYSAGTRPEVRIQLAGELKEMGRGEESLLLFKDLVEENLSTANIITCYESIGDLYLEFRHEPARALQWYQKLSDRGVAPEHTVMLSLKVSEAMIAAGEIEDAIAELIVLDESPVTGGLREEITYELGCVYFYVGRIEDAVHYFRRLVEQSPASRMTIGALEVLRLEKDFGSEETEALTLLGAAQYAERQAERTRARDLFARSISAAHDRILKDEIMLLLATALERWGDGNEALTIFEDLSTHAEEEYLAARALMEAGKIQFTVLGDWQAAKETFERLILEYSDVIETEEARHLLGKLEDRL